MIAEAKKFNVLSCGRRWGKTLFGAQHIAIPPMLDGYPVGWFAPSYDLMAQAWEMVMDTCRGYSAIIERKKDSCIIDTISGGRIDFWTMASSSADRSKVGRGRKYKVIVLDEFAHARYPESDWTKSISPTLADLDGNAWFFSTPWGRNYFWQLWSRGGSHENWASWQMPTRCNPYIPSVAIERARQDLPADAFAQEYEAKFLDDAANPFGLKAINACLQDLTIGPAVAYGIDLAKSHDWTVIIGLDSDGKVCEFHRYQKDWGATKAHILDTVGSTPTLIDSTGVGDAVVEDVQRVSPNIQGFKFTSLSKQQLMEGLMAAVQSCRVGVLRGTLQNEMEAFQYHYRPTGVRYEAPSGMHDDCVMALGLAWRQFDEQTAMNLDGVRLFGGVSSAYDGDDDDW